MKPLGGKVYGMNKHKRETVERAKRRQKKRARQAGKREGAGA